MKDAAAAMSADFIAYGHSATFIADLEGHMSAFQGADVTQNVGQQAVSGTTAEFGPLLEEGLTKVKQLDAFMYNFYKNNAEKMGEWLTASHVERQPKKKKDEPVPPP